MWGNQNASTHRIKNSLKPPKPSKLCQSVLLHLLRRSPLSQMRRKGSRYAHADGNCGSHFPPLCFTAKTYTFCPEGRLSQNVFCPRRHRDSFLAATWRNWRYVTSLQSSTHPVKILVFALFYSLNLEGRENSLFEVARLLPDANRHVASCVEVASLDGDSGATGYGTLGRLDTSEVRSLELDTERWFWHFLRIYWHNIRSTLNETHCKHFSGTRLSIMKSQQNKKNKL